MARARLMKAAHVTSWLLVIRLGIRWQLGVLGLGDAKTRRESRRRQNHIRLPECQACGNTVGKASVAP
jgi:hypothetical protein